MPLSDPNPTISPPVPTTTERGPTGGQTVSGQAGGSPSPSRTERVLIQAHQGGGGLGVASTEKQFRKAAKTRVYMVELDVQITRDGVIVVNHSDRIRDFIGRSCDHDGLRVHTVTYVQLKPVRCAGEPLVSFAEVLDIFRDTDIRLNVEIKAWDNESTQPDASLRAYATQIIETLYAGGYKDRFILSFLDWRVLIPTVRKLHPDLYVIALERSSKMMQPSTRMYQAVRDAADMGADAFEPDVPFAQESLLNFIKANGMDPQLWYVNTPEDVRFALAHGINPISTDYPALARDVIDDAARGTLIAAPVIHRLVPRTLLSAALRPGVTATIQVFGWGRVPLSGQAKLSAVEMKVATNSRGTGWLTLMPRDGDAATGITVPLKRGKAITKVLASPGDLGQITLMTTSSTTLRLRLGRVA